VIGAGLAITGNLESKGEVQVEGEVRGDIHAQRIIIGERAGQILRSEHKLKASAPVRLTC